MSEYIIKLRQELKNNVNEKTRNSAQNFFKEEVKFYGVRAAVVSHITRQYFEEVKELSKQDIFKLCEELLQSDYSEEAWVAFGWSEKLHKKYEKSDFSVFERWIDKYVNNWAKCDTLCNHTIGTFIEMYPEFISNLKTWAVSNNRWFRRAAAVTLILPARKGDFLDDTFEIADILLLDKDDLVQKGYGWMLKEASRTHQKEVLEYIMAHKNNMPRTALRYAIEKMPPELKKQAMAK